MNYVAEKYNRFRIRYRGEVPAVGSFYFTSDGETVREQFYLPAAEDGVFDSFTEGFLDGKLAFGLFDLRIEPRGDGEVTVEDISVSIEDVPGGGTYFIENDILKVGVELVWGGGLSYYEDKRCGIEGLRNMLNHADPGRLIQQSYYGTGDPPFVKGEFMGNPWVYNPVQGGDRGGCKSKLVDFRVSGNSVWVKCRPRDWGKVGSYTYSYMENIYTVDGDMLRVDNVFVDWSGWVHPRTTQEVPAFYTVSYLDNFYFYNGKKPWQDEPLQVRRDLIFWPEDWPRHRFPLEKENTETWAAWVDADDFGIGLYVPGAQLFIGGRYCHDGSKDPAAGPTNYVAPLYSLRIISYKPVTYSYLVTSGPLSDIRRRFKEEKDFADNASFRAYNE
ncbi:MAG: hypothetical protein J6330_01925 [Clostridia bacterium]|nr:hypothetical protein [Clostridia bacterium]